MQILPNCICIPSLGTLPYSVVKFHWTYYLSHQMQEKWQEDKEQRWEVSCCLCKWLAVGLSQCYSSSLSWCGYDVCARWKWLGAFWQQVDESDCSKENGISQTDVFTDKSSAQNTYGCKGLISNVLVLEVLKKETMHLET